MEEKTNSDIHQIWALNYHKFRLTLLRDIFINKLKINKNTKILDIGCGPCLFREFLSPEECPTITAFDLNPIISHSHPIDFLVGDAQKPNLSGQWDIIFAGEVIEHLPFPDIAFDSWDKLLKPGGIMVLTTPNGRYPDQFEQHISLMSIPKMKKIFQQHNYKIIEIKGNNFFIPFFDFIIRPLWKYRQVVDKIYNLKFNLPRKNLIFARNIIYIIQKGN
jgi:2-polyprenyl-3-methyl-5-hydroxy-6-metoxy-1,4-benzoquinol methylase